MIRAAETIQMTDTGRQRRDNEDSMYARAPVFVVADGMGGAQAGEVASRIAIEAFEQGLPDAGSPEERLAQRVREANQRIHELSRTEHERAGMGTTLTAAYLGDGDVAIAHVGDSRAYLFRDGSLQRLTQDHSLVGELVRRGKLTEEQAEEHPQRSIITRALGPEPSVQVDTWSYPVRDGDVLLLCSDGLTSMITEAQIVEILSSAGTLEEAGDRLISEANAAGGRDNITVVLSRLEDVGGDGAPLDQPTIAGERVPQAEADEGAVSGAPAAEAHEAPATRAAPPHAEGPRLQGAELTQAIATVPHAKPAPLARTQGRPQPPVQEGFRRRFRKPLAVTAAVLIVLFLIVGGGYLATRQLYFVGTNPQGIVTIYRGLPYDLPAGIRLYETFYESGVPASLVPVDRRGSVFNHHLRSQSDAIGLVRALELGQVSR
jgi:serine/threonine protein phosphatase PrpC